MSITDQFRGEIEDYLKVSGIDATTFGKRAMKDPRFVFDLRKGRSPSARTMDRVRAFMAANPPRKRAEEKKSGAAGKVVAQREERPRLAESAKHAAIAEEDRLRANWYGLLSRLLARAPDQVLLTTLRGLSGDESDFGQSLRALTAAAKATTLDAAKHEHFNLFVGVGASELTPYGSYYLAGFLHEKPLARLRSDMADLGMGRAEGVAESEDHIAALCEMMSGMILGSFGAPVDLARQRAFFTDHIGCWAPRFFEDLEAAQSAAFYMPVGTLGRLLMTVESQAFEMAA